MLSYRFCTTNDFQLRFHPVYRYIANLTCTQHLFEKTGKMKYMYSLYPGHLEYEQNGRKLKELIFLKGREEKWVS